MVATRPIIALAGRLVLIEVPRFDAGGKQRIMLQINYLRRVSEVLWRAGKGGKS
jgi:hypothetical protein